MMLHGAFAMIPLIEEHRQTLEALCREYRVKRLELFGSAVTGGFDSESSDLDFLVEIEDESSMGPFRQYFGFLRELTQLFGREVDLVEVGTLTNPYLIESVNATRTLLYAA
jgi:uncharacterized protein